MISKFDQSFLEKVHMIHDVKIFNELQNQKKIIIFDLRNRDEYNNCYLDESVNLPFDEYPEQFFDNFDEKIISEKVYQNDLKNKVLRFKRYYIAIILSENKISRKEILSMESSHLEKINKSLLLYNCLINKKVREIGLYNKGFDRICQHYNFLINNISCDSK
jgi:hypothetical protein